MTAASERVRALLPRGTLLSEGSFGARHRVIIALLALHIPVLGGVGAATGASPARLAIALLAVGALTALAAAPLARHTRMLAATAALSTASALLVHLTGGLVEAHFHYFFALALIALYQDWRPYLAATAGVVGHHVLVGLLQPASVFDHGAPLDHPVRWLALHAGFVLAVGVTHLVFWKITEDEQATSRELWRQLYEGERALVAQLQSAEAVKTELLSVVSHEFRTPLTSILGFSHTLMARADQLDPSTVRLCVGNIDQQSRRLARLVSNVLAASGDVAADPSARTDLVGCAQDVAREVRDAYRDAPVVAVEGPPCLTAAIERDAAQRILLNLLDNAVKFSALDEPVLAVLRAEDERAVVQVSNVAAAIPAADLERLFQPFVQRDSSDTRAADGIGLGLHVVRRIVEAHGGDIGVDHRGDRIVFVVSLPTGPPTAAPIDLRERLSAARGG
jgi:signal transduction histidine kinase